MKEEIIQSIEKVDRPIITVCGNEELTVENHKGIIELCENKIKIKSNIGFIEVEGLNFEIIYIGEYTLVVKGKIVSINIGDKFSA